MNRACILGYDPGGEHAHGLAFCEVIEVEGRWCPQPLRVATASSVREVVAWVETQAAGAHLLAVGLDTLTEWNSGSGGWRPADWWLRRAYPTVQNSVKTPNGLSGSMVINGASFLHLMTPRFQQDDTQITEAHPKVLYHAMTGRKHAWATDHAFMATWLLQELGLDLSHTIFGPKDHSFDAALSLLPALRGLNGDWTLDLHTLQDPRTGGRVCFAGETHYWWPQAAPVA